MKNFKNIIPILGFASLILAACTKMDHTYKEFIDNGVIVYVGRMDSVQAYGGNNRIKISGLLLSDPKIAKAKIFWNNRKDSVETVIHRTSGVDTVNVMLNNMPEGPYSFDIYTFDNEGHSSIKVEAAASSYGNAYAATLRGRPIKSANYLDDTLKIEWYSAGSQSAGVTLSYTNKEDKPVTLFVKSDTTISMLDDFKSGTKIKYTTSYLPVPLAIDTFRYTTDIDVWYTPVDYPKTGWIAFASSEDIANKRPAQNAIDNNNTTLWVNALTGGIVYPHFIGVDLGEVVDPIDGITFKQRPTAATAGSIKLIEVLLSLDNITWESQGEFTLDKIDPLQYVRFPTTKKARYFKIICKNDYNNSANAAIAEIGIFKRGKG